MALPGYGETCTDGSVANVPFVDASQICEGDDALLDEVSEVLDGGSLRPCCPLGVVEGGCVGEEGLGIELLGG